MTTDGQASACFYAFDMLHMGRDDLRPLELIGRRAMLRKLLRNAGPPLLFSEHMDSENGEAMFRHACGLGLEGIVSKRTTSRYKSGRCDAWRKVKNPAYGRGASQERSR
jgi:bifunctional non-homologous end joining protein LigD